MKGKWHLEWNLGQGNRHGGSILWGLVFLGLGGFVIASSMGWFGNVSIWTVVFTILLGMWLLDSLVNISFGGILFSLALLAILYEKQLGIESLTPWPVLWAALFGTVGLHLIFKRGRRRYGRGKDREPMIEVQGDSPDSEYFYVKQSFGSAVRYVNSKLLKKADLVNSFGSLAVYMDRAALQNHTAEINVSNSFGKTELYLPESWSVTVRMSDAMGNTNAEEHFRPEAQDQVVINGSTSFGEVKIFYI